VNGNKTGGITISTKRTEEKPKESRDCHIRTVGGRSAGKGKDWTKKSWYEGRSGASGCVENKGRAWAPAKAL